MRVLTVTHSHGLDGAATMLRAAVRHWTHDLQWRVDALCAPTDARKFGSLLAECGAVPVQRVDLASYDFVLINTALDAEKIDSLTQNRASLKIILWIHEGISVLRYSDIPISAWVRRFSRCRLVIYQTSWQRDEIFKSFSALVPPERIAVVPNGISVVQTAPHSHAGERPFTIACVASVDGRKRPGDLAKVVVALSRELPIQCEFIGSLASASSAGPEVAALIDNPPQALKWLGQLPHGETLERVARADLLCLPSGDESYPLAPLEAATRGVAVLLSRLPPYRHIGWREEENCLQHGVGNLPEIESQIRRLVSAPEFRLRIGQAGKQLADSLPLETSLRELTACISAAAQDARA